MAVTRSTTGHTLFSGLSYGTRLCQDVCSICEQDVRIHRDLVKAPCSQELKIIRSQLHASDLRKYLYMHPSASNINYFRGAWRLPLSSNAGQAPQLSTSTALTNHILMTDLWLHYRPVVLNRTCLSVPELPFKAPSRVQNVPERMCHKDLQKSHILPSLCSMSAGG